MPDTIHSAAYRQLREDLKAAWQPLNLACGICGQPIDYDGPRNEPDSFELDHVKPRRTHPELALDPRNCRPAHVRCNRARGLRADSAPVGEMTEEW